MRQSDIFEKLALLSQSGDQEQSNRYGALSVLVLDERNAERLMFGFPRKDGDRSDGLKLDVPGYARPVVLASERIIAMDIPSQRIADEVLSLGFLRGVSPAERLGWLESRLHTTDLDPFSELHPSFLGVTNQPSQIIRSHCRYDTLRSERWTVIVRHSGLHDGGPVRCRVFIPNDGTMELGGISKMGALWGIQAPTSIINEMERVRAQVKDPVDWERIPWEQIANAINKTLTVIAYDRGDSPIGFVRIAQEEFAPAF